ncbi:uncharacterized protein LOC132548129 [Ylistrum balloti]|uniref:uncharacterized protein LOC132548129 n=1 Tax=Ylistrum balloti TaxID=509963 RepID=UPI002905D315|nr:uncharacterized protein LOC132548129 [Ylistrum balloti]
MRSGILSFTVVIAVTLLMRVHTSCFIGHDQTTFMDRINNDKMFWQSQVFSVLSCLRQCYRFTGCMSFFYNEITKVCSLQSIVYLFEEQASTETGSRYFIPIQSGNCPVGGGFMHNRALEICYNFKCCNFYDALALKAECNASDTKLIKIDTAEKQNHMAAFLEQESTGYTLIQGTRDESGVYRYDDGTIMTYFNWDDEDNEPEERSGEVYILVKKQTQFQWHDALQHAQYNRSNLVCEASVL